MAAHRALGRRHVLPLHRRHDRHAEGRHVALRRPLGVLGRRDVHARRRAAARAARRRRRDRERDRRNGATPRTCPRRRSCTAPARSSSFQSMWAGGAHRHPRRPALRRRRAVARRSQRERVTQMAIVGDAFAKPMLKALEEAKRRASRTTSRRSQLVISSGVMWSAEVKQALMARGSFLCFDSLGSSEGVGFASSISAPGAEQATAKFSIGAAREGVQGRRRRGRARLGRDRHCSRSAGTSRSATTRTSRRARRRSRRSTASAGRCPATSRRVEADGTIVLLGRGSVVINSGGEKIFPEEVEEAVKLPPGGRRLSRGRRARRALRRGGHRGRVARAGHDGDRRRDRVPRSKALSRFKHPRHYVFVPERAARPERQGRLQVGEADRRRAAPA